VEGQSRIGEESPDFFNEQIIELHEKATSQTPHSSALMTIIEPRVLSEFQSALKAEPTLAQEVAELGAYPQIISPLLEVAEENEEAIFAKIMGLGSPAIPALIRLAFDQNPGHTIGSKHAITLLQRMEQDYPSDLVLLSDWLAKAERDWQRELLSSTMGKIGGFSTEDLSSIAANTSLDRGVRISALLALSERVQNIPEQREAMIQQFRHLLTRPEANAAPEEQFIGALIDIACDLDARELYPEIRQAYDEDRVDTFYITLADVHEAWGLERLHIPKQRTDGMYLPIKCKECGRTREHFTQYVMVEVDTLDRGLEDESGPFDPYILDHAIECPKCHSVDRYEFTPMAFARMTGPELFQAIAAENIGKKAPKIKPNPRVFYFRAGVFGEPMHPLIGLNEYRRRLTIQPENTDLLLGLGTLFRTILRYPEALQAHRTACKLAPNNPEVLFTCALTEHDLGDSEKARRLYQQVIDLGKTLKVGEDRFPSEITIAAIKGLQLLNHGRPSPWEGHFLNQAGHPVPHPSVTYKQHPIRKKKTKRGRRRTKK
jgi:tetratricopeptide (TPR) repeat protein